ncbi:MAG TPA: acyl carrier protein [Calditrichia bacterium]|nr:acyl carrier protein [Calditrichota bacterium]HQU73946.1 acyl carrier protein [Calditrichia bacterium]HQV34005.1 acyl carrier protein [Calditrichia bacterium]
MTFEDQLKQFISQDLLNGRVEVDSEDSLLEDDMVDSLGMLRLVMHIEEKLGIKIPHEDLIIENFHTVGVIVNYLDERGVLTKS